MGFKNDVSIGVGVGVVVVEGEEKGKKKAMIHEYNDVIIEYRFRDCFGAALSTALSGDSSFGLDIGSGSIVSKINDKFPAQTYSVKIKNPSRCRRRKLTSLSPI